MQEFSYLCWVPVNMDLSRRRAANTTDKEVFLHAELISECALAVTLAYLTYICSNFCPCRLRDVFWSWWKEWIRTQDNKFACSIPPSGPSGRRISYTPLGWLHSPNSWTVVSEVIQHALFIHTLYFRPICNSRFYLFPSSPHYMFRPYADIIRCLHLLKLFHSVVCAASPITCECDVSYLK
jgi:hypothetical protein